MDCGHSQQHLISLLIIYQCVLLNFSLTLQDHTHLLLPKEQKSYLYELSKKRPKCNNSIISELLVVDGTWIFEFEPKLFVDKSSGCGKFKLGL